jgi:hypothetical protein
MRDGHRKQKGSAAYSTAEGAVTMAHYLGISAEFGDVEPGKRDFR